MVDDEDSIQIGTLTLSTSNFKELLDRGLKNAKIKINESRIQSINGPFDGKINTIYTVNIATDNVTKKHVIFRARISKAFRYENIVKEKLLYPLLDGTLIIDNTLKTRKTIENIIRQKTGSHVFDPEMPPIVPVQDLYYFDETKKSLPWMYTIMDFIEGISLFEYLDKNGIKGKKWNEITPEARNFVMKIFQDAGEFLGKFHDIKFPAFYKSILDIGNPSREIKWKELFFQRVDDLLKEAEKFKAIKNILPKLKKYFNQNSDLIPEDETPVLFHNDYQPQNFIISVDDNKINGIIDFDNWQVGTREQDFIKIQYWGLKDLDPRFQQAFMTGYKKYQSIDSTFQQRVDLYKMQWFILVFNFEMDKIMKQEQNLTVDKRFPDAEKYIDEMKKILEK
ncbi:MAG: phosphotransferase family protein [Promethearchaeota archaeon]